MSGDRSNNVVAVDVQQPAGGGHARGVLQLAAVKLQGKRGKELVPDTVMLDLFVKRACSCVQG